VTRRVNGSDRASRGGRVGGPGCSEPRRAPRRDRWVFEDVDRPHWLGPRGLRHRGSRL